MRNKLSLVFLAGFALCLVWGVYELAIRFSPVPLALSSGLTVTHLQSSDSVPVRIRLPETGIDLPVNPVEIKNNSWPATLREVSFVSSSAVPGESGNSIFYGHDYQSLLGNLYKSRPGQRIIVEMGGGRLLSYSIDRLITVSPDDVSILLPTGRKQLTLYTCIGFLDRSRLAVIAYMQEK